jgi:glycosyltransferase involved in cell wall biosynthesis
MSNQILIGGDAHPDPTPGRLQGRGQRSYARRGMRALIVTSMYPRPDRPALGSFVRDQVRALSAIPDLELELFTFRSAGVSAYLSAARELRRRYGEERFDVVHAHFGLSAWPALAARGRIRGVTLHGTDLSHPRSRAITLAALPLLDLVGPVSDELSRRLPRRLVRGRLEVLPCGVATDRFHPIPRAQARRALGLDPYQRYLLFPSDPARPEKRYDRAQELAGRLPVLALREVEPEQVPLWVNAADAVLVPSEREGFGLAVLEALACDVPVLATPVGIAPDALSGLEGTLCAPFDATVWRDALSRVLAEPDPRVAGRPRAEAYSAPRMAERLAATWREMARRIP